MKFLKSKIALLLAVCMLIPSANFVFAADDETVIEDDGIFLSVDYEGEIPELERIEGGPAESVVIEEADGNHYFNVTPNWGNNGYKLKNPIPKNGGDYSLTFDFSLPRTVPPYNIVNLTEKATESDENVYHQFGLLGVDADGNFTVAGRVVEGLKWDPNKWYKYSLYFNRSMLQLDAVICEKDNEEAKGTYVGTPLRTSSTWGLGLENSREYDYLKFAFDGNLSIDNIFLEEGRRKPFSMKASSAHVGNIFSAKDKKQMDITLKNVLLEPATAELTYKILDEDGNQVDSGELKSISAKARETITTSITANVEKYGVYSLYCNVTAKGETGEPIAYESERIAFSVVNKREEGEPLNHFTSANIEYTDDFEQWLQVKEVLMQAGISNIRKDFLWWEVEPEQGKYVEPKNTVAFQDMMDSGIGNMIILGSSNPYYNNGNWDIARPDNIGTEEAWEGWAKYIDHVSKKYKDQVTYYEVINEPNWSMTAEAYYEYLRIAYPIIKKNDPDSIVAGLSTGSMPWAFIETVLSKISENPEKCIDVITVHPYDFDSTEEFGGALGGWSTLLRDQKLLDVLTRLKEMTKRYGLEDIPIQLTEMAITSTPGVASTKQQASDLAQLYASTYAQGNLDTIFWYCFENTGILGASEVSFVDAEDNFGMVANRADYVPYAAKPAYVALCGFNKMLTNAKPVDNIIEGWTSAYRFERDNKKQVVMLWTEHGSDNIALNLGTDNIEIFDKYTNPIGTMKSSNGIYDFTSTFEPIYIVGDFKKLERAKPTITVSNGQVYSVTDDKCEIVFTDKKKRDLRVEATDTPFVTIEKNTGIVNGKGTINVNVSKDAWQEEPIEVKIYDGKKLVYYTKMHLKIGDKGIDVKYSLGSDPSGNTNRSVINVSVTNKTSGIELSGKVNADFTLVGGKHEKRNIVRLKPGETKTVYLNIPQSSAVHSIGTTLDLNFGGRFDFNQQISVINNMNVLKNETGKEDISAFDIDLTKGDQYAANDALAAVSIPNWKGPEDAGLKGTLRWDEKNLYIYAEMSDDVFFQDWTGFDVWEGDGLQVGIQDLTTCNPGETAYTEFGITKTKNGNEFYRFSNQPGMDVPLGLVENCKLDIQVKPGKTIYKAVLPWSELIGRETVNPGDKFLFNISANENDGSGRRGWVELTEGICTKKNAQLFDTIILK